MKVLKLINHIVLLIWVVLLLIPAGVFAGGSMEESSSGSVQFQAVRGIISRPEDVITSSFISAIDYNYPEPEGDLGIYLYSGNKQILSSAGQQVFVAGIQGARLAMTDLPPMNLCFVIDNSGSMGGEAKMEWVWDSFDIFIDTVRDTDFVSVVRFDDKGEVMFPSTRMDTPAIRKKVREIVRSVHPSGGTNLAAGLELGYQQTMMNFREEYTNRGLFLTDGQGGSEGMVEMAGTFRDIGISISTIGLGSGFNGDLLREVARAGAGTSRFISDRETMMEVFGTGLSRMIVPVVEDLELVFTLPEGSRITGTWAYEYETEENSAVYRYPTVYVGDYETIIIQAELPQFDEGEIVSALKVTGKYTDSTGRRREMPAKYLELKVVGEGGVTDGFSDSVVLRSGTILHFAEALKKIGRLYYEGEGEQIDKENPDYGERIEGAIGISNSIKKELLSARERLDFIGFEEEIQIVESYLRILGGEAEYTAEQVEEIVSDREPELKMVEYPFPTRVGSLFRELVLTLQDQPEGVMIVSGFSFKDDREAQILEFLGNYAETNFAGIGTYPLVSREDLNKILIEQKLSLSGLFETENAIAVGEMLSAKYMVTGTVIEMKSSVIIFTRIIDIETAQILGASQIIVEKDEDVKALL